MKKIFSIMLISALLASTGMVSTASETAPVSAAAETPPASAVTGEASI
ncbi:MAG: hypothetical protein JJE49_08485 [Peptostreptococcaceae bacterium]|nr:hypothetical protein [Peptostreptococcaceae bacterium]